MMRRRYIGAKALTKIWTEWAYEGYITGSAEGVPNEYSCDGTYYTVYRLQSRHYQYPDGTGREATEYRAAYIEFQMETDGYCNYSEPLLEYQYYGYSTTSYYQAFMSSQTGSLWRKQFEQILYASADGSSYLPYGVYCYHKGSNYDVYSPSMNPNGSKYWEWWG